MNKKDKCETCDFMLKNNPTNLICRLNPPIAFPSQQINPLTQQPEMGVIAMMVPVQPDGWCGQYKQTVKLVS